MGSFEGISIGGRAAISMRRTTSGLLSVSKKRRRRRKERRTSGVFEMLYIHARVQQTRDTYIRVLHGLHFPYTHVHVHRVKSDRGVIDFAFKLFLPLLTLPLFFLRAIFFFNRIKRHAHTHTHTQTDRHMHRHTRAYVFPSGGDAFLFCSARGKLSFVTRNRVKKGEKNETIEEENLLRREERRASEN